MQKLVFALLALVVTVPAWADDAAEAAAKKQEMMKKWQEYSTPSAAHKVFAKMTGKWRYSAKFWEPGSNKEEKGSGTSVMKLVLGGRFLQHEAKGKAMKMPFEGRGLTGYNNLTSKYESIWADSWGTGMMHGTATFDDASQTFKESGEMTCPMSKGKTMAYRSEWKVVDKNHLLLTMWVNNEETDKEEKTMEMSYTRI